MRMRLIRNVILTAALLLGLTATAAPALASAKAPASCDQYSYGSPGNFSFTLHIVADTCARPIEASAHCVYGPHLAWAHGPKIYVAGLTSKANCNFGTSGIQDWGYRYEVGTTWHYVQIGHHQILP